MRDGLERKSQGPMVAAGQFEPRNDGVHQRGVPGRIRNMSGWIGILIITIIVFAVNALVARAMFGD
jgi:hypothetical protein